MYFIAKVMHGSIRDSLLMKRRSGRHSPNDPQAEKLYFSTRKLLCKPKLCLLFFWRKSEIIPRITFCDIVMMQGFFSLFYSRYRVIFTIIENSIFFSQANIPNWKLQILKIFKIKFKGTSKMMENVMFVYITLLNFSQAFFSNF